MGKKFAIIGVGGYIAPRHLESIKNSGHTLVAAYDINDSVGIMDRYFPDVPFFTEFERFQGHLENTEKPDFISICSPNYLHFDHSAFALRLGADVICEKPTVLTVSEVDRLAALEKQTGKKVYTVLQLRVHEAIMQLKQKVERENRDNYEVDLTYMTSRGPWYLESWKGEEKKSGGLSTNIGIHFFDMLTWIFGKAQEIRVNKKSTTSEQGFLRLQKAKVNWKLTIDRNELPVEAVSAGKTTYRSLSIDGETFEFSDKFTDLHQKVYSDVLSGQGYRVSDARAAVEIAEKIRGMK